MIRKFFIGYIFFVLGCGKGENPYTQTGEATFYADYFKGKITSSGERYHPDSLTAAHKFLPLGTKVEVTNLENDSSVMVKINDRGPYVSDRIIDLSKAAASKLGFITEGKTEVLIEVIQPAEGYDMSDSIATDRIEQYYKMQENTSE